MARSYPTKVININARGQRISNERTERVGTNRTGSNGSGGGAKKFYTASDANSFSAKPPARDAGIGK